jgi:endoglucanase
MPVDLEFLRDLLSAPGPSGFEEPAQEVVRRYAAAVASPETDVVGNVVAEVNPGGAHQVVITGHVDQIGLQVTWVNDGGFVYFDAIGSVAPLLLPGRALVVHGRGGPVRGVVGKKPTHVIPEAERNQAPPLHEQWIDIGAAGRDAALERIGVGDPITFEPNFAELSPGVVACQGLDDRTGVYVAFRALRLYADKPGKARLTALSTVQEETRFLGAMVGARRLAPDVMLVADGDFATDQPEVEPRKAGGALSLGGGVVLARGGATNPRLLTLALEVAAAEGVPVQVKAYPSETSTDNDVLQAAGVGTAAMNIGVAIRYMHSPNEVCATADLEAAAQLVAALARRIGEVVEPGYFVPRV